VNLTGCAAAAGLYVHVPFCRRKCLYCDFYSITDRSRLPAFLEALALEAALVGRLPGPFDTVYLGGGTPSCLDLRQMETLLQSVFFRLPVLPEAEITLEANPGSLTLQRCRALHGMGIGRLNVGVQSFDDRILTFLGRSHTARQARRVLGDARKAGFASLGLDLIFGVPNQTRAQWALDLESALAYGPEHLSCYMLTYEKDTPLERLRRQRAFVPPSEAAVGKLFVFTSRFLQDKGYVHYEISNFARGWENVSRHNTKYWSFAPYLGLGPSAHSFSGNERWWNTSSLDEYTRLLAAGRSPVSGQERLSRRQQMLEWILLGLRQKEGIRILPFEKRFSVDFWGTFGEVTERLRDKGMLQEREGRCALTLKGMLYLDSVVDRMGLMIDP